MTIELTPRELFFLAKLMNAKYLDYAYIAMMPDIQINYSLNEIEALEALSDKGYVESDFAGELDIDPQVINIMSPVFFGTVECLIIKNDKKYRIHQSDSNMILSEISDSSNLEFRQIDDNMLRSMLDSDIEIECANIDEGTYTNKFSASELQDEEIKKRVIKCMKGEW